MRASVWIREAGCDPPGLAWSLPCQVLIIEGALWRSFVGRRPRSSLQRSGRQAERTGKPMQHRQSYPQCPGKQLAAFQSDRSESSFLAVQQPRRTLTTIASQPAAGRTVPAAKSARRSRSMRQLAGGTRHSPFAAAALTIQSASRYKLGHRAPVAQLDRAADF